MNVADRPRLSAAEAGGIAHEHFAVTGVAEELDGERDRNYRVHSDTGAEYVLKIAHPDEEPVVLDLQGAALNHLAAGTRPDLFPGVVPTFDGRSSTTVEIDGRRHLVRLLTWIDGTPFAGVDAPARDLLSDVGRVIATMDRDLASFAHRGMHRFIRWDSRHAPSVLDRLAAGIGNGSRRELVRRLADEALTRIETHMQRLETGVIHNDVNDHNLLVSGDRVSGIIDFGDMVHTYRVCDPANAIAYLMLDRDDPYPIAAAVLGGYAAISPLGPDERAVLRDFVILRLCLSVTIAAHQRLEAPDNAYLGVSERPAWTLLERLHDEPQQAWNELRDAAAGRHAFPARAVDDLLRLRDAGLSATLGVSYRNPLKITRGEGQYLFDDANRRYLDCVNNVCHVGHCHPRVVEAGRRQMAVLNTNTRYLHDNIVEYARRLTAALPDPLEVCFFVNSGSEANDLALRLAREYSGAEDVIVIDHAYHGHTRSLIDVSPYKFDGRGGRGAADTTHVVPIPDRYRGTYGYDMPDAGPRYAAFVQEAVEGLHRRGRRPAAFMVESFPGCAGQVELPPGYLEPAFAAVRAAGGVCIADEVQVGFGRVGSHRWAFELQDVVPDIVTMGKPIGNGHPLGAVVTTRRVADAFRTGMEYFNTFGGNPVSCAIGLAVLDVIEDEGLIVHAAEVGEVFLEGLRSLATRHEIIGDVRGRGLFIGVELVRDRGTREPATDEAAEIIERMKDRGVLLSTDGPFANVIKIKPPMVITRDDVESVVRELDDVLGTTAGASST